ncbi:MAG: hypothetical protein AAFR31_05690 [Cyanobacteria bacterium J06627_8]
MFLKTPDMYRCDRTNPKQRDRSGQRRLLGRQIDEPVTVNPWQLEMTLGELSLKDKSSGG